MQCLLCSFGLNQKANIADIIMTVTMTMTKKIYIKSVLKLSFLFVAIWCYTFNYRNNHNLFPNTVLVITSVSKKSGQTIVLYHYCGVSSFFLKQTLFKVRKVTRFFVMNLFGQCFDTQCNNFLKCQKFNRGEASKTFPCCHVYFFHNQALST